MKTIPELPADYVESQLRLLRRSLSEASYPGYPERHNRLVRTIAALGRTATNALILPEGPWTTHGHNVFREDNDQPTSLKSDQLAHEGHELDSKGRPLHPWFRTMIEDPNIGVVTGKGSYWSWGPNRTADSVVVHGESVLLVQRKDTGDWALPGGFIDTGEHAAVAAKRETREETAVDLRDVYGIPFYKGPVIDPRITAHAWPETTAYLFQLDPAASAPEARAGDDAAALEWKSFEELGELKLFGSHAFLAQLALSQLDVVRSQATAAR